MGVEPEEPEPFGADPGDDPIGSPRHLAHTFVETGREAALI